MASFDLYVNCQKQDDAFSCHLGVKTLPTINIQIARSTPTAATIRSTICSSAKGFRQGRDAGFLLVP
jgi:hypothetical protein